MISDPTQILHSFFVQRRTARNLILKGANLRRRDLAGLRADGLDLEEADLREICLIQVRWKACVLHDARLEAADFTDAVLRLCDLDQTRATNAKFVRTRLENSTARGARFDGADLTGAVLTDTDFSRASFRGANLEGVSASGANFRGADLSDAKLLNAEFVDVDLSGADLTGAELQGVDLRGAILRGALGIDPALQEAESQWGELPPEMRDLAGMMTPIVIEALRTAGQRDVLDPNTAARMLEEVARYQGASPRNIPSPDTLKAVSLVMSELGDNTLSALFGTLQLPKGAEPPPEVKALILRLRKAFALDETASAEDVLLRLINGVD